MERNYSCIELFAGAGGLSLGLEKANINTVAFIEFNHDACVTLRNNRPHWNVIEQDITTMDWSGYHSEIVTGGFPCQSFSYAGKRLGMEDTRGTLFYEFARCVESVKPKIFLAENVVGLLTHDKGKTFEVVKSVFTDIGYRVTNKILDAYDYGVPQKRERLFIVGIREDIETEFEWPIPLKEHRTVGMALKDCPSSVGYLYSDKKREIMELVPEGGNWRDLPIDKRLEYIGVEKFSGGGNTGVARRLNRKAPSPTIVCSPMQKQTERCHPTETRPLNIRESARIQTFDDDWEFYGSLASQYKQIGNAVPVLLGKHLGKSLHNFIDSIEMKITN